MHILFIQVQVFDHFSIPQILPTSLKEHFTSCESNQNMSFSVKILFTNIDRELVWFIQFEYLWESTPLSMEPACDLSCDSC